MTVERGNTATGKQQASRRSINEELAGTGLGPRLTIEADPDTKAKRVGLPRCTFAEAIRVCAHPLWHEGADSVASGFLDHPASQTAKEQPIHATDLTFHTDGSLKQIRLSGCTVEQALLTCAFVVKFDALASNHWLDPVMPEREKIDLRSWLGWDE
jgi:hypothetical protein